MGAGRRRRSEDVILTGQGPAGAHRAHTLTPRHGADAQTAERRTEMPAASGDALLGLILASLDDDSAEDIVSIPLAGKSQEADHMVIASGRSSRHVSALAEKLSERLKHEAGIAPRAEGKETADWVLIDAGDVIVHIFRPEVREFYQLEKMWMAPADRTARAARTA